MSLFIVAFRTEFSLGNIREITSPIQENMVLCKSKNIIDRLRRFLKTLLNLINSLIWRKLIETYISFRKSSLRCEIIERTHWGVYLPQPMNTLVDDALSLADFVL
jgi:hypothetical protein